MNIYDYIFKENIISKEECEWALDEANDYEWFSHGWSTKDDDGKFKELKTNHKTELSVASPEKNSDLDRILRKGIDTAIKLYLEKYPYCSVKRNTPPRLNKYSKNTEMREHVDHIHGIFDGNKKGIPIISIVGVLNDNYDGGEFIFNDEYEVKFKAGDILIFPSVFLYKHKVNLVDGGTRLSFVSWGY